MTEKCASISGFLLSLIFLAAPVMTVAATASSSVAPVDEGIRFSCAPAQLDRAEKGVERYFNTLGITADMVIKDKNQPEGTLRFTLNTPEDDYDTLRLKDRSELAIQDDIVRLPAGNGKVQRVTTVSQKEIVLALLQHGRLTAFSGKNCNAEALKELVGVRQNIAAWSENLNWIWPDGEAAEWNKKYWRLGTPLSGVPLHAAFNDVFMNQHKYSIGCYTAAKIVMVQGILDYYRRVQHDPVRLKLVKTRLLSDHDPLVDVEPGEMWSFEKDYVASDRNRAGKILQIQHGFHPRNFVPGDWAYMLNNDPVSSLKTGYEGSNAIYLGRNKFADFYNDNHHTYTYEEKLDEVYQWRHGVFSRYRDFAKIHPLSDEGLEQLGRSPDAGGFVLNFRVFPLRLMPD
jgi:hypothetical protein